MGRMDLFLVLIIFLIVLLVILVIILVTFREAIREQCCWPGNEDSEAETQRQRGVRNPGFHDQEHLGSVTPRPFNNMEATECPPSYEEAVKQELFRFRLPPQPRSRSSSLNDISEIPSTSSCSEPEESLSPPVLPETCPTLASTSSSRGRSSTVGSSTLSSHLSTIEEESEESSSSVTVVIDCIGVKAARLMDKCETSVSLESGQELSAHSKC